ncbi:DUF4142 domain-containing protein [Mucilaginibacter sp. RCC_168]|uniref:DUF4142 domain-containing protein n=1 Tax=Mucilaginibacter sp. RCC_168 TaxID=3239221 RepID=UPI0035232A9D
MKQIAGILMGLITLVWVQGCTDRKRPSNYNNEPTVNAREEAFLKDATEASQAVVKISDLAMSNSKNLQIIRFAKVMMDKHTQLGTDLKKLATDNFVTSEDSLNTAHQQLITDLEKKQAKQFDNAYLQEIINEYEPEIKRYTFASHYPNANVADFAKQKLSVLQAQLDSAKAIATVLK